MTAQPTNVLRVKSHRATHKLKGITTDIQWWFNFHEGNNFATIPDEHVPAALEITGITRARPKHDLMKCWSWE